MTRIGSRYITKQATELEVQNNGSAVVNTDKINFVGATVTDNPTGTAKVTITGVSLWTESESASTQQNTRWTPNNAAANISAVIQPKGTGANMANRPDGTATGGNARGQYATDFQKNRTSAAHVASGNNSVVVGGKNNTASGAQSSVLAGEDNTASGIDSAVINGSQNTASGSYSIASGLENVATNTGCIALGGNNIVSGVYAAALNKDNAAGGGYGFSTGRYASARLLSARAHSSNSINGANVKDNQIIDLLAGIKYSATTGAASQLYIDATSELITPLDNSAWLVSIESIATVLSTSGTTTGISAGDCFFQKDILSLFKTAGAITQIGATTNQFLTSSAGLATASISYTFNAHLNIFFNMATFAGGGSCTMKITSSIKITELLNT